MGAKERNWLAVENNHHLPEQGSSSADQKFKATAFKSQNLHKKNKTKTCFQDKDHGLLMEKKRSLNVIGLLRCICKAFKNMIYC